MGNCVCIGGDGKAFDEIDKQRQERYLQESNPDDAATVEGDKNMEYHDAIASLTVVRGESKALTSPDSKPASQHFLTSQPSLAVDQATQTDDALLGGVGPDSPSTHLSCRTAPCSSADFYTCDGESRTMSLASAVNVPPTEGLNPSAPAEEPEWSEAEGFMASAESFTQSLTVTRQDAAEGDADFTGNVVVETDYQVLKWAHPKMLEAAGVRRTETDAERGEASDEAKQAACSLNSSHVGPLSLLTGSHLDGTAVKLETINSRTPVKVAVLVRPLNEGETSRGLTNIVELTESSKVTLYYNQVVPSRKVEKEYEPVKAAFEFDQAYLMKEECEVSFFEECVAPVLNRVCQGFPGTILAYGQTGAGKTYTMGIQPGRGYFMDEDPRGLVPRAMRYLLAYTELAKRNYEAKLKVSFYEIYNEEIRDLLFGFNKGASPPTSPVSAKTPPAPPSVAIRMHQTTGEVYLENITEVEILDISTIIDLVQHGNSLRKIGPTRWNDQGSRSHGIINVVLEQTLKLNAVDPIPESLSFLKSQLQLVDLAGSERARDIDKTGARVAESSSINKSLMALGNVINGLSSNSHQPITYRNSKLTRVLQQSLGGNSETLLIACLAPTEESAELSVATLRYASRARRIRNYLRFISAMSPEEEVKHLQHVNKQQMAEITRLKQMLDAIKSKSAKQ